MSPQRSPIYEDSGGGIVAKLCQTFATPWSVACQAPLSVGFSRQEYWNGLPFPSPGDLPNPGGKPRSTALQADSLLTELQGKHSTKCFHFNSAKKTFRVITPGTVLMLMKTTKPKLSIMKKAAE